MAIASNHSHPQVAGETFDTTWSRTMALVEADGYNVTDSYGPPALRSSLREIKDTTGVPLYVPNLVSGGATQMVYGIPIHYVDNGAWSDPNKAQALLGDASLAVIGMRQRLTAKRLTEATVNGISLPEHDMLALRVKIRLGFSVLVPKGLGQSATPFPFAVVGPGSYETQQMANGYPDNANPLLWNFRSPNASTWDFGDGSTAPANIAPTHTYAAAGNYTVIARSPDGQVAQMRISVVTGAGAPKVTTLAPATKANNTSVNVVITGTGFVSGCRAHLGDAIAATTFTSATSVTAAVTPGMIPLAGVLPMWVVNPDGTSTNSQNFTVT
jgi:hypothetical protein